MRNLKESFGDGVVWVFAFLPLAFVAWFAAHWKED
jgi:hypothetical protein